MMLMKVVVDRETLGSSLEKAEILFYGFAGALYLGLLGEVFSGLGFLPFLFWFVVVSLALRSFRQVFLNLQYSFWSFGVVFFVYGLVSLFNNKDSFFIVNCYVVALVQLFFLFLILSSPFFYSRIVWWECHPCSREELEVEVEVDGKKVPGRLTDLKKQGVCTVLFERFDPKIEAQLQRQGHQWDVKVVSRRKLMFGRGYLYGMKFSSEENNLQHLKIKRNS